MDRFQRSTDEDLAGLAACGDSGARDELIRRCLPVAEGIARNYGRRMRHDAATTDDHVQNASLSLIGAIDRFNRSLGVPLSNYLRSTISLDVHGSYMRSLSADATAGGGSISLSGGKPRRAQHSDEIDPVSPPDHAAEEIARSEEREALIAAVGKLREPMLRDIVLMRHGWHAIYWGQEMTYRDIAQAIGGISDETVRSDYLHAVAELRGLLPMPDCRLGS